MNALTARGHTASPSSMTPTRRELREEVAADRAECMEECLSHQDRFRDDIAALFEQIDTIGVQIAGRCSEFNYDPGLDRIASAREANMLLNMARLNVRNALTAMQDAL